MKEVTFLAIGLCIGLYIGRLKNAVNKEVKQPCPCPKT